MSLRLQRGGTALKRNVSVMRFFAVNGVRFRHLVAGAFCSCCSMVLLAYESRPAGRELNELEMKQS